MIDTCPICAQGQIGFRKCANSPQIVLMCDECDSVWLDPDSVTANNVIYLESPNFEIPLQNCSMINSRWATRDEVCQRGWEKYCGRDGKALDES